MRRLPILVVAASAVVALAFAALVLIALRSGRYESVLLGVMAVAIQASVVSTRRAQTQSLADSRSIRGEVRDVVRRSSDASQRIDALVGALDAIELRQAELIRRIDSGERESADRHMETRKHLNALGRRMDNLLEADERRAQVVPAPVARMESSVDARVAKTAAQFDWLARHQRRFERTLQEVLERLGELTRDVRVIDGTPTGPSGEDR